MARDAMRQVQAFQWQQQHPDEPEERDIAVDPFSLRQFSRLNIDRPLPIPSVSVSDPHVSPARFGIGDSRSGSAPGPAASSPRVSIASRLNELAEATGWDDPARSPSPAQQAPSVPVPGGKSSAAAGGETKELVADGEFDVVLSSSGRKASEPQRWGSDVPLIAAARADDEEAAGYSFPNNACGKSGSWGKARRRAGEAAPFSCCMYVPGMSRKGRPPMPPPASSSPGALGRAVAAEKQKQYTGDDDPAGTGTARQSTVSLAVSLERFDCGSPSTSSWGDLDLDGKVSSSSCFDLPLELILGCDDDDESDLPVWAAFLFDSDVVRKSVLNKRLADDGAREARRPSLGRVSVGASGRSSAAHARVSLKSRSPPAPASP
jgi:hypothetical protein